jgi:hypothetical protein
MPEPGLDDHHARPQPRSAPKRSHPVAPGPEPGLVFGQGRQRYIGRRDNSN